MQATKDRFLAPQGDDDRFSQTSIEWETCKIETRRLPRQTLPRLQVTDRTHESWMAGLHHVAAKSGANHHVPTTPLTVTWGSWK
jgi:hypothetical protein